MVSRREEGGRTNDKQGACMRFVCVPALTGGRGRLIPWAKSQCCSLQFGETLAIRQCFSFQ